MIQSTTALEMVSHHLTSHELCDLLSAALFTLGALTRLYMTILITDYSPWFRMWGFSIHVHATGQSYVKFLLSWLAWQLFKVDNCTKRAMIRVICPTLCMMFVSLHIKIVLNAELWGGESCFSQLFWWAGFLRVDCVSLWTCSFETEQAVRLHVAAGVTYSVMPASFLVGSSVPASRVHFKPACRSFRSPIPGS